VNASRGSRCPLRAAFQRIGSAGRCHNAPVRSIKDIMRDGARRTEEKHRALEAQAAAHRRTLAQELAALSDEELITKAAARSSLSHPYHEMEMQRRLKVATQEQTAESVRARRAANRIGVALVALTVVLVALTVVLAARS
jgi:DNA-binding HxlR family transcriptional regulator